MARHFAAEDAPKLARYWKAIVAALGAVVVIGNEALKALDSGYGDGTWDVGDTVTGAIAVFTAFGVWRKANTPAPRPPTPTQED